MLSLSTAGKTALGMGLLLTSFTARAQQTRISDRNNNAWLMYFSDARLTKRWGLHTEFQYRRTNGLRDPQQYFYRIGANYHATDKLMLTAGYAYLLSLPYGDYPDAGRSHERRLYQQVQLDEEYGRLAVMHRIRQDQRWQLAPGTSTYKISNRSRYRLQLTLPIRGRHDEPGTLYATAYNEIFISYGPNVGQDIFNQNRTYGALGYQFSKTMGLELGYLLQILQHEDGQVIEYNSTFQAGLTFNPDFRKRD